MQRHPAIDQIARLAVERLNARRVWLFGSRGRGDHAALSDIDMAFEVPAEKHTAWGVFAADVHEHARTFLDVDLIDIDQCDEVLRAEILKTGVLLHDVG